MYIQVYSSFFEQPNSVKKGKPTMLNSARQLLRPFVSPDTYDFWARELGTTAAWDRTYARVVGRHDEAIDCFTLRLAPNANMPAYQSGQHINLSVEINSRRVTRSYSLTSHPGDRELSITVRREPHGQMSQWLYEHARHGTVLEIDTVFGNMTLAAAEVRRTDTLLFLAAGSGITPLYSLIRDALATGHSGPMQLLYWDKSPEHFCFQSELDALSREHSLCVHRIATRQPGTADSHSARISSTQLQQLAGAPVDADTKTFICGGADFVQAARACCRELALDQVVAESFTPLAVSESGVAETFYRVELARSGKAVEVSSGSSLLDALETAGIVLKSGCRMGICNTCSCQTLTGTTLDTNSGQLNPGGATRLCVSRARSHLILDL